MICSARAFQLLALSGHSRHGCQCPVSGVKRTWPIAVQMSANDPKQTSNTTLKILRDSRVARLALQEAYLLSLRQLLL